MNEPTRPSASGDRPVGPRCGARLIAIVRAAFVAYLILLTFLLFMKDPTSSAEVQPLLIRLLYSVAHLLTFLVLGLLAMAARWPLPLWGIVLCLAVYGAGTELLQVYTADRSPELLDWLQDAAGMILGVAAYHVAAAVALRSCAKHAGGVP